MAAKRKKRGGKSGLATLITTTKTLRILAGMGVDTDKFIAAYIADKSRGPRTSGWDDAQIKAIKAFKSKPYTQDGFEALQKALGKKNPATVFAALKRYEEAETAGLI